MISIRHFYSTLLWFIQLTMKKKSILKVQEVFEKNLKTVIFCNKWAEGDAGQCLLIGSEITPSHLVCLLFLY